MRYNYWGIIIEVQYTLAKNLSTNVSGQPDFMQSYMALKSDTGIIQSISMCMTNSDLFAIFTPCLCNRSMLGLAISLSRTASLSVVIPFVYCGYIPLCGYIPFCGYIPLWGYILFCGYIICLLMVINLISFVKLLWLKLKQSLQCKSSSGHIHLSFVVILRIQYIANTFHLII